MFWTILLVIAGSVTLLFATIFVLLVVAAVRSDLMINKCLLDKSFSDSLQVPQLNTLNLDESEPVRAGMLNAG